jgi:hypothetical protein
MSTYRKLAEQAAQLEREQCYYQAAEAWEQAYQWACQLENLLWCKLRADFCRHARRWVERGINRQSVA